MNNKISWIYGKDNEGRRMITRVEDYLEGEYEWFIPICEAHHLAISENYDNDYFMVNGRIIITDLVMADITANFNGFDTMKEAAQWLDDTPEMLDPED